MAVVKGDFQKADFQRDVQIAIVGRACRLPGAKSPQELWALLAQGRSAVSRIPADRWLLERFGHPRQKERGRSYSWSAGVLDDPWGFDPAVFGISPREAEQMDPQQRLLLELTFEALEDAGIAPSSLAGPQTGVFIGGSSLDYGNLRLHDPAAADAYFATGNTLATLSNRISYVFDLRGPSFTIDTACSSSLFALDAALAALSSGAIETAIVGAANMLVSPFGFISFSQAGMLSPTGLCQAFSAHADGYVRSEGGVVLVLRSLGRARVGRDRPHALIAAHAVNCDGRTSGISLPSAAGQRALLEGIYAGGRFNPDDVAFVEAHGTGTRVGDPAEAAAIGEALAKRRRRPLPIGSIKTNIGHLEPASGLAGIMKAMLSLEHDEFPATLHCDELNPDIPFGELNLSVARKPAPLPRSGRVRYAGVSSFGFGGANAHIVLSDPPAPAQPSVSDAAHPPLFLMLSAQSESALAELARGYAARLADAEPDAFRRVVAAAGRRREALTQRLVIPADTQENVVKALREAGDEAAGGRAGAPIACAAAVAKEAATVFVYSGNGSQWPGMGQHAYRTNEVFRARFDAIDALFERLAGWSLTAAMFDADIAARLRRTSVAQPLAFAIQAATTHCLAKLGLRPAIVLGHSMGEVAAAEAAGILDLASAVRVIHFRSLRQELVCEAGGLAVAFASREAIEAAVAQLPPLVVAAHNSAGCFTVSGPAAALDELAKIGRARQFRVRRLDIAYPFHSALMGPVEGPLLADLAGLQPRPARIPFVSTVDGAALSGVELDAFYWWRNVREPVLFMEAVALAAREASVFVEVGPNQALLGDVKEIAGEAGAAFAALCVHRQKAAGDPFRRVVAEALAHGAAVDRAIVFGDDLGAVDGLPSYPWRRQTFRVGETSESSGLLGARRWHPLIGARASNDALEWRAQLDAALVPALADHRIEGQTLVPGAAFAEMALAVAADWLDSRAVTIESLDVLQPLILPPNGSREILCRASPATGAIEILSRPRLSGAAFVIHARATAVRKPGPAPAARAPKRFEKTVSGREIYARAEQAGLEFGPAFRQAASAGRDGRTIIVNLLPPAPSPAPSPYGLDPARLDSCFHGLILLFEDFATKSRPAAYLPVRFGEIRLERPGAAIAQAEIRVKRIDERAIVADFTLFDADGALIAILRDARYQAARAPHEGDLSSHALISALALADAPTATPSALELDPERLLRAAARGAVAALPADLVLVEGWAAAAAYHFAARLAESGALAPELLARDGRLGAERETWLGNLVTALIESGLAEQDGASFRLVHGLDMPQPDEVLQALAADHPARSAELLLAARMGAALAALARGEAFGGFSAATVEAFELGGVGAVAAADRLRDLVHETLGDWPSGRALRILQIGHGPLTSRIEELARRRAARLTIYEPDPIRLQRARLALPPGAAVDFLDDLAAAAPGFDLIVAADALHRLAPARAAMARLAELLAPGGVLAAVEPQPSLFRDFVFGLDPAWLAGAPQPGRIPTSAQWSERLASAGLAFAGGAAIATAAGPALLVCGRMAALAKSPPAPDAARASALIVCGPHDAEGLALALTRRLAEAGFDCAPAGAGGAFDHVIVLADAPRGAPVEALAGLCLELKTAAEALGRRRAGLWIVTRGALAGEGANPVAAGVFAFARTLANEFQGLAVRRVDLAPDLAPQTAAERLAALITSKTAETDILLEALATRVVRFCAEDVAEAFAHWPPAEACRLEKGDGGALDRIRWTPIARRAPGPGEIEIEVAASGLNFRDVMWGLSALPDDILEDGFAGPTLGLECAGRVVAVGSGVEGFEPGDGAVAFAGGAFASHVTVAASVAAAIPAGLPAEAAAAIPVAFLTAYYALVDCARLEPGELILIHGGAGGVGLAALQIARWRGARVIATAGSAEKRDLLRALGAEYAFDGRSEGFVDEVRRVAPEGVAIVLNSLAGEAMERSISLLAPFGRFVELGKRDYVANTQIGLRPFRRNLSYFGVDLDQLILAQADKGRRLFREVMALFVEGALWPPPYRCFGARESVDAMRLMQQSGHVGKIVIAPPKPGEIRVAPHGRFAPDPERTHLIVGGFGGFGLAAARWLAARGARHLALVGRSGAATPDARAALAEFAAAGIKVHAGALDIADVCAAERLCATLAATMAPLAGVIHAAAALDDGLIAGLEAERLTAVLAPKVAGAENLDRLTRGAALDYFVLFSSATTMIGNPGQGAYVAANGYLEGLARRRRAEGLPALAIAWGGIDDVGLIARNRALKETLANRAGVKGMKAARALDLMGEALARSGGESVLVIADMNWRAARAHLPLLGSPSYAGLISEEGAGDADSREGIDLAALIAAKSVEEVRSVVVETIVEDIARILRLPAESVSRGKPLAEIGLDSLMAVELGASLEERLSLEAPLAASAGGFNVRELAGHIIAVCASETGEEDSVAVNLARKHLGGAGAQTVAPLTVLVEAESRNLTRILP